MRLGACIHMLWMGQLGVKSQFCSTLIRFGFGRGVINFMPPPPRDKFNPLPSQFEFIPQLALPFTQMVLYMNVFMIDSTLLCK